MWAHLLADSIDELHRFASQLGLKRGWYQGHTRYPHYDITDTMRAKAISLGAQEVDGYKFVEVSKRLRTERNAHYRAMTAQLSLL